MLKLLNGFVLKRLIAAASGGLAVIFGRDYGSYIAGLLVDPDFIQRVFDLLGSALLIYAGLARKDVTAAKETLDKVEDLVEDYLPKVELDPYPGWDYDPIRGWVKLDE